MSYASKSKEIGKLLILCVDRDNDLGTKAGIETPIIGKEKCKDAASSLALADPEEADANAIFATIKECEDLEGKGYDCEIAIVSGSAKGGIEADRKVREELLFLIERIKPNGIVLVSDGIEDEKVIPIIQSIIPIISVKRVIIRHSQRIEESYEVLGRYLKILVTEPRYARYVLGVPGLLLLMIGILTLTGLVKEATTIALILIGGALIVKAFELDRLVAALPSLKLSSYLRLFSIAVSLLIILAGIYLGFTNLPQEYVDKVSNDPAVIFVIGPALLGHFLQGSINLVWAGLAFNFIGAFLYHWFRRSMRAITDVVGVVILSLLYLPVLQFSLVLTGKGSALTLVIYIFIGLAAAFLAVGLAYSYFIAKRKVKRGSVANTA
jgi:putative membrane protein